MATRSELTKNRGHAKRLITRRINEIIELMDHNENMETVKRKSAELSELYANFVTSHEELHQIIEDEDDQEMSIAYFEQVTDRVRHLQENIRLWCTGVETSNYLKEIDVNPDDSISNLGSASSTKSMLSEARAQAAARKAMFEAEEATITKLHELELQELQLRQQKETLTLSINKAKAEAEEKTYAQAGSMIQHSTPHGEFLPPPDTENRSTAIKQDQRRVSRHEETPAIGGRITDPSTQEWRYEVSNGRPNIVNPWRPLRQPSPTRTAEMERLLLQQQEAMMSLTLPQQDLPVFDGNPVEYNDFIRAFENVIERKTSSASSRLYYLLQYTKGQVQELVRSCLAMKDNEGYVQARKLLKEKYGQSYKIASALMGKLANVPPIKAEDGPALERFSILLTSCGNTLTEIGYLSRLENPDGLKKIINVLPFTMKQKWRDVVDNIMIKNNRDPTVKDLKEFIEAKARAANHPIFGQIATNVNNSTTRNTTPVRKARTFATEAKPVSSTTRKCPACTENHWLSQCERFKGMNVEERNKFVRENKLCMNCLTTGHFVRNCERRSFCRIKDCNTKHSTFLHKQGNAPNQSQSDNVNSNQATNAFVKSSQALHTAKCLGKSTVGLPIVPVKVKGKGQVKEVVTYALLDTGSNTTFCTDALLKRLGLQGVKSALSLTTLHRERETVQCSLVSLEISAMENNKYIQLPMVYSRATLPISKDNIGKQEDVDRWPQLQGVQIHEIDADIGLLIGSDVPDVLKPKETKATREGGPYATRTVLGWTISGPLDRKKRAVPATNFSNDTDELSQQFSEYCNREFNDSSYQTARQSLSQNDKKALEVMSSTIKLVNGHYEMALPWKNYPPNLRSNRCVAERRLGLLKKRLQQNPVTLKKYQDFMNDLLQKNYAQRISIEQRESTATWYLPHHPVQHPQKPDKVRVVFDCSARYRDTSLNDQLLQGPDLTNTLVGVLTRFRQEPIALMSDIESMFYQVRVRPSDCDYLRYLWWPNGDLTKEPEEYQMLVHLFGGASSPSCANYALKTTAKDNEMDFDPVTIQTVNENFYVDDCLRSVATEEEAIRLTGQLSQLLKRGGFRLTKWTSNSFSVINAIPESERATSVKNLDFDYTTLTERALGVRWNVHDDTFSYKIESKERPATRRGILSIISSVYDPLGFVSPCILPAKAILQDLCVKGLGWDDEIPEADEKKWKTWLKDLPKLEQFVVPRCFKSPDSTQIKRRELHHFSDASTQGYGAVSYLRQIDENGQIHCSLVMAKSRLAPLKTMTIPRMELSAAVLATRLDRMLSQELTIDIASSTFWTDSTCVLRYVENKDTRFHTFVANRITAILDQSTPQQWRYVDTARNPADEASRGMTVNDLLTSQRWTKGPSFLLQSEDAWPQRPADMTKITSDDPEVKKTAEAHASVAVKNDDPIEKALTRFSLWTKLRRTIAWVLRYKNVLLRRVRQRKEQDETKEEAKPLSASEIKRAESAIIKYVQKRSFEEELRNLHSSCSTKKVSNLYKLDPMLDDGLLRVGGRLNQAPLEDDVRHPVILPKNHHLSNLIINFYHDLSAHSGVEHTLSLIRQNYWIIGARASVRSILNRCFDCRRRQAPVMQQKMASLPADRVTASKPPFTFVGVDCFGPFEVRRGRVNVKRYGVLFTCLTLRAVHIEIANSLDTDSFINALRRFISRRGLPQEMRSDNGGNFVRGEKELRMAVENWNQSHISDHLSQRGIKWIFNPPAGSHHGGVWERCIRTVRKVLRALVKEQSLDDEGLSTLMCEVESIVNGRPITKMSDDPRDAEPLTPNHLLLLRSGTSAPPGTFDKDDNYGRRRWRQVQYLSDVFWRRWIREYLPSLQERQKWNKKQRNVAVNDVVLVADNNTPRSSWPLARVLEVYTSSKDGLVRSVKLKTSKTELIRPIDKIVLLEAAEVTASKTD